MEGSEQTYVEELYQWERKGLLGGYSSSKLLPTDPTQFTDLQGAHRPLKDQLVLPEGWNWVCDWQVVVSKETDESGWQYGWNVTAQGTQWKVKDAVGLWVRRRKWVRPRKKIAHTGVSQFRVEQDSNNNNNNNNNKEKEDKKEDKKEKEEEGNKDNVLGGGVVGNGNKSSIVRTSSIASQVGLGNSAIYGVARVGQAEVVDLQSVHFVYSCSAARNKKEVLALLNWSSGSSSQSSQSSGSTSLNVTNMSMDTENLLSTSKPSLQSSSAASSSSSLVPRVEMLSYQTPNTFFASWTRLFQDHDAAIGRHEKPLQHDAGMVVVIYDLEDDEDVLSAVLHPVLTAGGEYANDDARRQQDVQRRLQHFAVVLAGWRGPTSLCMPRVATDQKTIPPIRISVHKLE